jgi:hypothetical protein
MFFRLAGNERNIVMARTAMRLQEKSQGKPKEGREIEKTTQYDTIRSAQLANTTTTHPLTNERGPALSCLRSAHRQAVASLPQKLEARLKRAIA